MQEQPHKPPLPFYSATDYPTAPRELLATALRFLKSKPPAETSHPLVEANLLEHGNTRIVVLSNWSGQPQRDLTVTVRGVAAGSRAQGTLRKIHCMESQADEITLTLDVEACEFIVVTHDN